MRVKINLLNSILSCHPRAHFSCYPRACFSCHPRACFSCHPRACFSCHTLAWPEYQVSLFNSLFWIFGSSPNMTIFFTVIFILVSIVILVLDTGIQWVYLALFSGLSDLVRQWQFDFSKLFLLSPTIYLY